MIGRLLCRLGLHRDEHKRAQDGEGIYARCRRCGRDRDIPGFRIGG